MSYDFIFPIGTLQRDIQRTGEYLKALLRLEKLSKDQTKFMSSYSVDYGRPLSKKELLWQIDFNKRRLKILLGKL